MEDTLQTLRRQWEASGDTEDEALYLQELVRCGDLTEERLQWAARLGHPAAVAAGGGKPVRDALADCLESPTLDRAAALRFGSDCVARTLVAHDHVMPEDDQPWRWVKMVRDSLEETPDVGPLRAAEKAARQWPRRTRTSAVNSCSSLLSAALADDSESRWLVVDACEGALGAREELGEVVGEFPEEEFAWQRGRLCEYILGRI